MKSSCWSLFYISQKIFGVYLIFVIRFYGLYLIFFYVLMCRMTMDTFWDCKEEFVYYFFLFSFCYFHFFLLLLLLYSAIAYYFEHGHAKLWFRSLFFISLFIYFHFIVIYLCSWFLICLQIKASLNNTYCGLIFLQIKASLNKLWI